MEAKRNFEIGQRIAERPTRSVGKNNAMPCKRGEVIDIEEYKQKSKRAKAGFSLRKRLHVKWDGRSVVEKVDVFRVIHEHELSAEAELARMEV